MLMFLQWPLMLMKHTDQIFGDFIFLFVFFFSVYNFVKIVLVDLYV